MPQMRPRVFSKTEEIGIVATSPLDDLPAYQPSPPSETYRDELPTLGDKFIHKEEEPFVAITVYLPQELHNQYHNIALAQELTIEEVIQQRLESCKSHNALRGLWFSDSERGQLENLIQKWPLESAFQALSLLSKAASVKFDDVEVVLTQAQKRVLSLAMFGGRTPKSFFESLVKRELRV